MVMPELAVKMANRGRLSEPQRLALAVMVGGAAGALARAGVSEALPRSPGAWPWATFSVNLGGAVLLAWVITRLSEVTVPTRYQRPLIGTGFCGALTTFSTFQVETIELSREGEPALAVAYAGVSLAAGMLLVVMATVFARRRRYG